MGPTEKKEKKGIISGLIDLASGRFKDSEINTLYNLVENRSKYDGTSKTKKHSFTDFSSDGKYTRTEEKTYTIHSNDDKVHISEHYDFCDDDGYSGSEDHDYKTAREILNILKLIFPDLDI